MSKKKIQKEQVLWLSAGEPRGPVSQQQQQQACGRLAGTALAQYFGRSYEPRFLILPLRYNFYELAYTYFIRAIRFLSLKLYPSE